jgi:putative aldouronate transport system substrate-binding protein
VKGKVRNALTAAMVLVAGTGLLAIGATGADAASAKASHLVKVSMFGQSGNGVLDLKTNWFTKYVRSKFGLNIHWVLAPAGDLTSKQSLLVASGNYPDIFFNGQFSPTEVLQNAQEGLFVPLNSYIKKYAPNVWRAIQTAPGYKAAAEAPNGKIYALPAYNYCAHCDYPAQMWIDTAAFAKAHVPIPRGPISLPAFESMLIKFKQHGITPFSSAPSLTAQPLAPIINALIYDDGSDFFDVNNGKLSFAPEQPAWKSALTYAHALFAKGLLNTEIFTQSGSQITSLADANKVAIVVAHSASDIVSGYGVGKEWRSWTTTLPVLRGPHGVEWTRFAGNQPTGETFAATNKATPEQIIATVKLLNFMYTPTGQQIEDFGPAGIYWTPAKRGQKGLTGQQALFNTDWNKFYGAVTPQNYGWNTMGPMYQSEVWRNGGVALPPFSPNGSQSDLQLQVELHYMGHQPKEVFPGVIWVPTAEAQQYAMDQTNIDDYVNQWQAAFVTGTKPLSDWNTYVQGLQHLGLQQYIQLSQKYMGKPFITTSFRPSASAIRFLEHLR